MNQAYTRSIFGPFSPENCINSVWCLCSITQGCKSGFWCLLVLFPFDANSTAWYFHYLFCTFWITTKQKPVYYTEMKAWRPSRKSFPFDVSNLARLTVCCGDLISKWILNIRYTYCKVRHRHRNTQFHTNAKFMNITIYPSLRTFTLGPYFLVQITRFWTCHFAFWKSVPLGILGPLPYSTQNLPFFTP